MDARTWSLAVNTLLLCGATCAISLPLGSVLAWLLLRTDLPGRRVGMVLLAVMLFVPLYLQAAAWQAGFGLQGWWTLLIDTPPWLEGFRGAVWVHSTAAVPWVVLIVGLGLGMVEPELEEQALLDGSVGQVFFRVTLRSALPALGAAALWVAIVAAGEITVTDLFQVRTYAEELFTRLGPKGMSPEEAIRGMGPGLGLTAGLAVAVVLLAAKLLPRRRPVSLRRRRVFGLGAWRIPMGLLAGLVLLGLIGVPLAGLCYKAGIVVRPTDGGWQPTWSVGNCGRMVARCLVACRREFGWSLGIGSLAATGAVVGGIALAWPAIAAQRRVERGTGTFGQGCLSPFRLPPFRARAAPALLVVAVGLALPAPVVGLGIVWLVDACDCRFVYWLYDQPIPAPCMALVVRGLPLATLIAWHALRTVPVELLETAAADGAGPLRRLWSVALRLRLSAVALAWVVALAVALGDLGASFPVVPPGVETLSIRINRMLHSGQGFEVAGTCLALGLLFAVVGGAAVWLVGRWGRPTAAR